MARDRVQELLETTNAYLERARHGETVALTYRHALWDILNLPPERYDEIPELARLALAANAEAILRFRCAPAGDIAAMCAADRAA